MGKASRVATVLVIFGVMAGPASAQGLQAPSPPAEQPPDSFEGAQFVDSRGCVYVRAGLSGTTTWVPRVNRQRQQVCGAEPTLAAGARPDPQAADAPDRPRTAAAPPTAKGAREPSPEAGGPAPRRRGPGRPAPDDPGPDLRGTGPRRPAFRRRAHGPAYRLPGATDGGGAAGAVHAPPSTARRDLPSCGPRPPRPAAAAIPTRWTPRRAASEPRSPRAPPGAAGQAARLSWPAPKRP
jgi:hypothetical protein